MPFVPARPSSLNHLSDEAASLALDKHLGDFVKAAKELNINRGDLRKLTWHNPRILDAVHERMDLFRSGVRSKILGAIYSGSTKRRRWGYDAMFDCYEFRNQSAAYAFLAPAPRRRVKAPEPNPSRLALEREAAAELARDRAVELEYERWCELAGDEMTAKRIEPLDWSDVEPVSETLAPVIEPVEPAPVEPEFELPAWPGPYAPLPLVAHLYAPWTPPKVILAPQQQPQREHAPELRRRLSRGGWR